MSAEVRSRIISRIRKMLRLANDAGATEGERDNALRMAHATLAKYNLDLALIEESTHHASADEPREEQISEFGGWPWARAICASVADLFFCSYLYAKGRSVRTTKHYFVGRRANATTAALIAEYVVKSVLTEAAKQARGAYEKNSFVRSFGWGAALGVRERVAELKRDAEQMRPEASKPAKATAPGQALVLASVYRKELEANQAYVQNRWGVRLGKARRAKFTTTRFDAFASGHEYGSIVSLQRQVADRGAP